MIHLLINAIIAHTRVLLGPPGFCRYEFSCTQFARMEFRDKRFFVALISIAKRVLSCNILWR